MSDSLFKVTFKDVVEYMSSDRELIGDFPPKILESRLRSIGVQEAISKHAIAERGFPFKYHHPLDEAILVLHYFLTRSKEIGGSYVQINSTHVPTKEEESTLSFWKSPKAGLYLDLHALIENHNHRQGKIGHIKRAFVFRDHAQLAFLESTGIGVILEQESIGIETGLLLTSEHHQKDAEITTGGVVLVQLIHNDDEQCEWFLGIDKTEPAQQPYESHLICKWHKGSRVIDSKTGKLTKTAANEKVIDLGHYLELFDFELGHPEDKTGDRSYRFVTKPEEFVRLLKAHFGKAFDKRDISQANYDSQLSVRAIPKNFKQFCRALEQINQSAEIRAVDASSVKNTLRVHEADPNYRHWIRTSVQRAIKNSQVFLDRIYILDLYWTNDEYEVFQQEMNLYQDLITNRISRLDEIATGVRPTVDPADFPTNIRLYAITKRCLEEICRKTPEDVCRALSNHLLKDEFVKEEGHDIGHYMPKLDFLYSEGMVFNYKDYRGEPGRAFYDADLLVPGEGRDEKKIIKYLSAVEFQRRKSKYSRLFEILRKRSIQVLPSQTGVCPTPDHFKRELEAKGVEPITMAEVLGKSGMIDPKTERKSPEEERRPIIFVSYASADKEKVVQICERLRNEGYEPWEYENGIHVGEHPTKTQDAAVKHCDFFLACLSRTYNHRRGEIRRELKLARERREKLLEDDIFILLARLDSEDVPEDLAEDFKYVTLFSGDTPQDEGWKKLLEAIRVGLQKRKS